MNNALGFIYSILATILYGLYAVPKQYTAASLRSFLFWMGAGLLITSVLICPIIETINDITFFQYLLMFSSGIVWSIGMLGYISSLQYIGLARSTPIKNINGALGTIYGILIFHEFSINKPVPLVLAVIGSISVVISGALLGRLQITSERPDQSENSRNIFIGIFWASVAAIAFSIYSIPMKIVLNQGIGPITFLFYMAQGCLIGNTLAALFTPRQSARITLRMHDYSLCLFAGFIWAIATIFSNLSVKIIGITISWPIVNLNTVVAVAYGIIILREIKISQHKPAFWSGIATTIIGVGLLAAAMETN